MLTSDSFGWGRTQTHSNSAAHELEERIKDVAKSRLNIIPTICHLATLPRRRGGPNIVHHRQLDHRACEISVEAKPKRIEPYWLKLGGK